MLGTARTIRGTLPAVLGTAYVDGFTKGRNGVLLGSIFVHYSKMVLDRIIKTDRFELLIECLTQGVQGS